MATFLGLWSETSLKTAFGAADGALPRIVVKGHPRRQDPGLMLKLAESWARIGQFLPQQFDLDVNLGHDASMATLSRNEV